MYRVAVIEDEDIIRKGLVYSIPWETYGCVIVGEGRNGVEGIEILEKMSPDILIVDINMPIMDGLEMIRNTYEKCEYAAIILSGYSSFEYAQQAIRYGVLGYLLKPLDEDEIKQAIEKAKKELKIGRAYQEQQKTIKEWKEISIIEKYEILDDEDGIIQKIFDFIEENYQRKITMYDFSKKFKYSETYLNKKFKKVTGTTMIEYLNRYRIQKALEMIRAGKDSIQDIAWKCGIGEYKYFLTVFKKYLGCSPKAYKNMVKNDK